MSRFSSLLCSLLFCMITYAQEITVTGKVTAGGEEMPGVTVAVKGQTRGTITSTDGSYQIQVNGNESLIFSFVGYETITIPVNRRKVINIELKEAAQMVDEVVITVPYGTAKKSTFTGSASYIAAGTIEKAQVSSVSKALQGTVAGLQSFSSSGQPGSDATILIRGVGSVNASTNITENACIRIFRSHLVQCIIHIPMTTSLTQCRRTRHHHLRFTKRTFDSPSDCLAHIIRSQFTGTWQSFGQASLDLIV